MEEEEKKPKKVSLFDRLKQGLTKAKQGITDRIDEVLKAYTKVDEELLEDLEEVLITADVGVNTTMDIIEKLEDVIRTKKITDPQDVREELKLIIEDILSKDDTKLDVSHSPTIILMVGVNGVGKTTTIGKLAHRYKSEGKKVLLAAGDTFRAAAIDQLEVWANRCNVDIIKHQEGADPGAVIFDAIKASKARGVDVLICDTAGRLHIDEDMMQELEDIKANVNVDATVLVVDAMTGQDAVNVAQNFSDKVGIDGVILTKMDGDTRGGAALSIKAVTGKPIFYVGMGEKLSDLEQFYPDRMASRILGMGDVMSLIEKAQANIDEEKAKAMEQKMKKAQFDFNDYLDSMEQMRNMGGISSILNMLPGVGAKMKGQDLESMVDEKDMARKEAIVLSMTPKERENPDLINPSRKQRIAKGAGVDIAEVNRFIKQFEQSRKMMKQMTGMVGKGGKRGGFKLPF